MFDNAVSRGVYLAVAQRKMHRAPLDVQMANFAASRDGRQALALCIGFVMILVVLAAAIATAFSASLGESWWKLPVRILAVMTLAFGSSSILYGFLAWRHEMPGK